MLDYRNGHVTVQQGDAYAFRAHCFGFVRRAERPGSAQLHEERGSVQQELPGRRLQQPGPSRQLRRDGPRPQMNLRPRPAFGMKSVASDSAERFLGL